MGNPAAVIIDPGLLWAAPLGTTEPTGNATVQPGPIAGFRALGYTGNGSTFTYTPSFQPIYVEEELDPIRWAPDKRDSMIEFLLDEINRANYAFALNVGANAVNDTSILEPVDLGSEVRVMLMWDSTVTGSRILLRQCIQVGPVALGRHKAPNKTEIGVKFQLEKPVGLRPFKVFPATAGALV